MPVKAEYLMIGAFLGAALAASGPLTEVHQLVCFRPARPAPTHRIADVSP